MLKKFLSLQVFIDHTFMLIVLKKKEIPLDTRKSLIFHRIGIQLANR